MQIFEVEDGVGLEATSNYVGEPHSAACWSSFSL